MILLKIEVAYQFKAIDLWKVPSPAPPESTVWVYACMHGFGR